MKLSVHTFWMAPNCLKLEISLDLYRNTQYNNDFAVIMSGEANTVYGALIVVTATS